MSRRTTARFNALDQRPASPDAAAGLPAVVLKSAISFPLVYRKRVDRSEGSPRPGDLVAVYAPSQKLLGYGLFNPRSEILVRIIRWGEELPDDAYWQAKLTAAVRLRREMLRLDEVTDAYRLVHAESDELSGLVVDKLGDVLSIEAFSLGMFQRAVAIAEWLAPQCGVKHTFIRPSPHFLSQEGLEPSPIGSEGLPSHAVIQEFGTRFRVGFTEGHKTGFFCDQRDNRRRLAEFCRDRTVLDLCCYSGGFAVQAKRLGGASEVTGVDLDEEPLRLARENANLNQMRIKFVQADAFIYMRDMLAAGRQFDVVVLDPPKLIRSRPEYEEGRRKHFDLNRLAMQLVRPGGLLLTCSCAGLLSEEEFLKLLNQAARQAGPADSTGSPTSRTLRILARSGAAADHPVAGSIPETEYLKAVWMVLD